MELEAVGGVRGRDRASLWDQAAAYRAASGAYSRRDGEALPDSSMTGALPPVEGEDKSAQGGWVKGGAAKAADSGECQTCKNRTYQDGSDDPGVSFKTPSKIDPGNVASAVRGHEMEHVTREQFQAVQDGRKVVSQSVTLHNGICPECGKAYISGGTTRTVTKGQEAQLFQAGQSTGQESGQKLDANG